MLLKHGAPSRPRTPDADTPYSLAEKYNKIEMLEILERFELETTIHKTNQQEWLHSNLSREDANSLLEKHGLSQGLFLVRPNSKRAGYYALSLVDNKIPYHFVIVSLADQWFYIDDGPIFSNLTSIICHYSLFADGLPTILQQAVRPYIPAIANPNIVHPTLQYDFHNSHCNPHNARALVSAEYSHISEWMNDNFVKSSKRIPVIKYSQLQLFTEIGSGEFGAVSYLIQYIDYNI